MGIMRGFTLHAARAAAGLQPAAGCCCVCTRACFFAVSLRDGSAFARGFFFLSFFFILCNLFLGRERNLYFRSGFLSLPKPLPHFQHRGFIVASFERSSKLGSLEQAVYCEAVSLRQACFVKKKDTICRWQNICRLQIKNLPITNEKFAVGQRRTCRRQIFCLPTANEKFADGECLAGRRQISYLINGKCKFCRRQIFLFAIGKIIDTASAI